MFLPVRVVEPEEFEAWLVGMDDGGMDGMDMTTTTMDMGSDAPAEDGGDAEDEGGMVLLEPGTPDSSEAGQFSIMEFTIPDDAVGTWEIGCFQEAGQHYEDGMRATLIVEP